MMTFILQPWQLLLTILAGLISRQQQQIIEYLRAENQVLKEAHGKRRIRLNDDQRRRLAVKGKVLGRKILGEIGTSFTPDTIRRWHRQLAAEKWDLSQRCKTVGRPLGAIDFMTIEVWTKSGLATFYLALGGQRAARVDSRPPSIDSDRPSSIDGSCSFAGR
jgi:hypothetical protein